MRIHDFVVGQFYILNKNKKFKGYEYFNHETKKCSGKSEVFDLNKDAILQCVSLPIKIKGYEGSYYNRPVFAIINGAAPKKYLYCHVPARTHYYDSYDHSDILKTNYIGDGIKMPSGREIKAAEYERKLAQINEKVSKMSEELANLNSQKPELEEKISLLRQFATDEEELAYTLSQIMQTGGDQVAILKLLQNRAETSKL